PTEDKARKRARMPGGGSIDRHTFIARVQDAQKAVADIRKVAYQLIRLRRVQSGLKMESFSLTNAIRQCTQISIANNPNVVMDSEGLSEVELVGNEESLRYAIDEVLSNSCRELQVRAVAEPAIRIRCGADDGNAWISISDNGLPADVPLIDGVFEECITTYEQSGRGTGLGLTIVRETFRAHAGDCSLDA